MPPSTRPLYLTLLLALSWGCTLQATPCTLTTDHFRKSLIEFLSAVAVSSSLQVQPVSSHSTRSVIQKHLDNGLLSGALKVEGINFIFVLPGQEVESQLEVLMLSYRDEKTAMRMQQKLVGKGKHFKNTIILTRFSSASVGNHLLVIFTEKSGNEAVVKLIDDLPESLKREYGTCTPSAVQPPPTRPSR